MNWLNKHLNWTYFVAFVVSIIVVALMVSLGKSNTYVITGAVLSLVINMVSGGWVLRKKGQSLWLLGLAVIISIVFIFVVLLSPNKKTGQSNKHAIDDDTYYKSREK